MTGTRHALGIVLPGVFSGCALMPRFEVEKAREMVPSIREYALANIPDLTDREREFIRETEPGIGHANYTIYYYTWRNSEGKALFSVEAFPPSCGFEPTRANRVSESGNEDEGYARPVD